MVFLYKIAVILSIFFLFGESSFADLCNDQVPQNSVFHFARVILDEHGDYAAKIDSLKNACRVFDKKDEYSKVVNKLTPSDFSMRVTIAALFEASDAFRKIGANAMEVSFNDRLKEIKKNPSAIERVKATYELVLLFKKPFDQAYMQAILDHKPAPKRPLVLKPEVTLEKGGVCRDFARLLEWSLLQVARSSSESKSAEVFSYEFQSASGKGGGHAWISVNLPIRSLDRKRTEFSRIDLDPTNFTDKFVPLPPLAQGQPESRIDQYANTCAKIISCLTFKRLESERAATIPSHHERVSY